MGQALGLNEVAVERCVEAKRISLEEWIIHWPSVEKELDTIPQHWEDYWTKEFINNAVLSQNWQAWGFGKVGIINVVVLTQVMSFPANRFLQIPLAFGNSLDECLPLMEATFERFAIEMECDIVEIIGRFGWERKLPRFRRSAVVLKARVAKQEIH